MTSRDRPPPAPPILARPRSTPFAVPRAIDGSADASGSARTTEQRKALAVEEARLRSELLREIAELDVPTVTSVRAAAWAVSMVDVTSRRLAAAKKLGCADEW